MSYESASVSGYVRVRLGRAVVTVLTLSCLLPATAFAHGQPPLSLALWGPFGAPTTVCMRDISTAARRCFRAALAAHRACGEAKLAGGACDQVGRDAAIAAAEATAESTVTSSCLGGQLTELRFASFDDAKRDVMHACRQADGVADLLYPPAASTALPPDVRPCVVQTAALSAKLVDVIMRARTMVLDHVATSILKPSQRLALLAQANRYVTAVEVTIAGQLGQACPQFAAMYGQDPVGFVAALEARANCVIGIVYVQTAIECPLPYCGNGIREDGEQCDDGNANNDDACRNDCTVSAAAFRKADR